MRFGIRAFLLNLFGQPRCARLAALLAITLFSVMLAVAVVAEPTVIYNFSTPELSTNAVLTNNDGFSPNSRLVLGANGNLYGTTLEGGSNGAGSIFSMTVSGLLSEIYAFPPATNQAGEVNYDLEPNDLVQGNDGNFYGTTQQGGSNFNGSIFVISPTGQFTNLYTFGPDILSAFNIVTAADGSRPLGALVQAANNNFYGATQSGGPSNTGTIFQITSAGAFTSLYTFSGSPAGSENTNGAFPNSLVLASNGNLYGTTKRGGIANAGTFFTFSPTSNSFAQLYSFDGEATNAKPITPGSALAQGTNGNFYGTSLYGGAMGGGSVFEITESNNLTKGIVLLHSFPLLNAGAGSELTLGADGNFFGTTEPNGLGGSGTLFRMTEQGDLGSYVFPSLETNGDNTGGANPSGELASDPNGNLYGTRTDGGTNGSGFVFQISDTNFIPAYFVSVSNSPPVVTNVLVGASVSLAYDAQGLAPLTVQWLKNGTNLANGGDVVGAQTTNLLFTSVFSSDSGSYALVISNVWGAVTSPVTALTVKGPSVTILSPLANARASSFVFGGTATIAPYTNSASNEVVLTNIIFSITNLFNGSNSSGVVPVVPATNSFSNASWSFTTPLFPGTNVVSVQSVDVSGNVSPVVSEYFFYEAPTPLTIISTGTGSGTFTFTNGAMLDIGGGYTITAKPNASDFQYWILDGVQTFDPTISFVMQTNLVLIADFVAKQPPGVSISFPKANDRISSPVFEGTASTTPLLAGVNPTNVQITNVVFWLTNSASLSITTGQAALTNGNTVSNWTIDLTGSPPLPGANVLAVQSQDISGGLSSVVAHEFFYEVPALFTITKTGTGNGTFTGSAVAAGDVPPTNGAMLNIGETYKITAKPDPFSVFAGWVLSTGGNVSSATLPFVMQPGLSLTAMFNAKPPLVTISSPAANLRTSAPVFTGTASSHYGISNVSYTLTGTLTGPFTNSLALLTKGTGSVSNWSIAVVPWPGTNVLTVQSTDDSGDLSALVSRTFFYKVPSLFTLSNAGIGNGTITGMAAAAGDVPPTNNAMLNIGEAYTLTAKPDKFSVFSEWITPAGSSNGSKLTFIMQPEYAVTAVFGASPPLVAITSPTANQRTAQPSFAGTASSHFGLANVAYSLTNTLTGSATNGFATLTTGTGASSNWSIAVTPLPGSNIISVQSMDVAGNTSAFVSQTFFYEAQAPLAIMKDGPGNGTFAGAARAPLLTNGSMLYIGQNYAITAKPDQFSFFSNWISAAGVTVSPTLDFIMQSNLQLTATFATNFFITSAGTYNGLFYPSGDVAEETSGLLYNLVLRNTGAFSGNLLLTGNHYPFSTNFDVSGQAAFHAGPFQVDLNLDSTNLQITGTVSSSQWTANLLANAASNTLPSAEYTMIFSASTNVSADSPPGDGYALLTNNNGVVTLSGAMADGTSFSQTVPVSLAGDVPVYAVLYTNVAHASPGLLLGWINLTNLQAAAPSNELTWVKKALPLPAIYTNGFTNVLSGLGSLWTNQPPTSLTNGDLVISNADLFLNFTNIVVTGNTLSNLGGIPSNYLTGAINPKTGLLTIAFGNGNTTNHATAAVLQNISTAGGFFLTRTNAASVILQP